MVERFFDGGTRAPLIVRPRGATSPEGLAELVAAHAHDLRERLAWAGAVVFRGFGVVEPRDLSRVVRAFSDGAPLPYVGDALRDNVYTSTEASAGVRIPLHSEMSSLPAHPRHLFFACMQPATRGGETTLADTRAVLASLSPPVRERFLMRGVRYVRVMRGQSRLIELVERVAAASKSWMDVFETERPDEAEARCRALALDHRWLPSGHLETSTVRPAVIAHRVTGEPVWFNQAHLFSFSPRCMGRLYYSLAMMFYPRRRTRSHRAEYGDSSAIEPAVLAHVLDVLDRNTVACAWRRGDLLIVDNETCMHGRNPFRGARRVLVSMTD
ncbi:MAG TPA: TauD/TfdA family dioxygenase [Polyangia bacterium]